MQNHYLPNSRKFYIYLDVQSSQLQNTSKGKYFFLPKTCKDASIRITKAISRQVHHKKPYGLDISTQVTETIREGNVNHCNTEGVSTSQGNRPGIQQLTETGIILLQIYSQIFDKEMITIIKDIYGRIQDPKYWKQQKVNWAVP